MRTKKVTRHYCDFCSRGSFSKPAMVKHERGCCKNKDRVCGYCADMGNTQKSHADICLAAEDGIEALKSLVDGCPACTLTGIIHAQKAYLEEGEEYPSKGWAFKKARDEFWDEKNHMLAEMMGNRG